MSNINQLIQSATDYVLDTKPFHSKLKNVSINLDFEDSIKLKVLDDKSNISIHLQNLWRKQDIGGYRLFDTVSGNKPEYRIPFFHVPRYSLNDYLSNQQYPAFDPVNVDLSDLNGDGFADSDIPWRQEFSWSHQDASNQIDILHYISNVDYELVSVLPVSSDASNLYRATIQYKSIFDIPTSQEIGIASTAIIQKNNVQVSPVINNGRYELLQSVDITIQPGDLLYSGIASSRLQDYDYWSIAKFRTIKNDLTALFTGNTGRYHVPFHNGSRVYVNGTKQIYFVDYIVDKSRGFIQFLDGKHPSVNSKIDINYFLVDRFFISVNEPFEHNIKYNYDSHPMDFMPYDFGVIGDYFEFTIDNNSIHRSPVSFFNITPGTTKGYIENLEINPNIATIGNVYRLMAISEYKFQVYKNGELQSNILNYDVPFNFDGISGKITNSWNNYYINQDSNSYRLYDLDKFYDDFDFDARQYDYNNGLKTPYELDVQDHLQNLDIQTIRGKYNNSMPIHDDYDINPFGTIIEKSENGEVYFVFKFNSILKAGTRVEFRIEQAGQYNQILNIDMNDSVDIKISKSEILNNNVNTTVDESLVSYVPFISEAILYPPVLVSYFTSSIYPILIEEQDELLSQSSLYSSYVIDEIEDKVQSFIPTITNASLVESIIYRSIEVEELNEVQSFIPTITNASLINTINPITYNDIDHQIVHYIPTITNVSLI